MWPQLPGQVPSVINCIFKYSKVFDIKCLHYQGKAPLIQVEDPSLLANPEINPDLFEGDIMGIDPKTGVVYNDCITLNNHSA